MKNKLLLFITYSIISLVSSYAQTIINVSVSHQTFCPGSKINVTFETTGTFQSGNTFIAQLSNQNGSFTTFSTIGSTMAGSNSIDAVVPDKTQSASYKIRVISSSPYYVGPDNNVSLTLQSNPQPTFAYEIGGVESDHNTPILIGHSVIFKNTSPTNGQCEWNFGPGASVNNFIGCNPPPITYGITGIKNPSLKIVEGVCAATSSTYSPTINVVTCNPQIPSSVHVIKSGEERDGENTAILVCPGAVYRTNMRSGKEVYIETGGTFILDYIGGSTAFATKGSVAQFNYNYGAAIYEEAASVTGKANTKILCPSVTFDYSLVKCKCNDDCGIAGVNANITTPRLSLFPNPTQGNVVINGADEKFSLAIYNAQGNFISEKVFNSSSLNLSDLFEGFYIVKITDGHGVRSEKLIISK